MRISNGLISNMFLLFNKVVFDNKINTYNLIGRYYDLNFETNDLLDFAEECNWMKRYDENYFMLSDKGISLFSEFNGYELTADILRTVLFDYVIFKKPSWSYRIPFGRKEATIYMSLDEKQCFYLAKLLVEEIDEECMEWWDNLASQIRVQDSLHKSDIGRSGELLSINYEMRRTGKKPFWNSFETNLNGYDLLSVLDKESKNNLLIEVKASTRGIKNATFFLTKNEWCTAYTSQNYVFHIWLIGENNKLAIVTIDEMQSHIPQNLGAGVWQQVEIPFKSFDEFFQSIDPLN